MNAADTVICSILSTDSNMLFEYTYKTEKRILKDSTVTFFYTDKVENSENIANQFIKSLYEPLEKHHTKEEQDLNNIRLESMRDEDKSQITITKNGELQRYLRIRESFILDMNLKPKLSYYNYEIKRITNSNTR